VSENRSDCQGNPSNSTIIRTRNTLAALSETLRNGAASGTATPVKGEERISLFWRVFGGTLLSIAALVVVTLYQQFGNSLLELRNDMIRLNEAHADMIKKDEFNNRMNSVWNNMKDLQTANASVAGLRERTVLLEQQLKDAGSERKELSRELQQLRDRLASAEGQLKSKHGAGD
jgi:septal ring factor EnvC (AmiA/AmiB activator)